MILAHHLTDYATTLLARMGCAYDEAHTVAEALVAADLMGVHAHGVACLPDYYLMITSGRIRIDPDVQIVYQTPSTATVDGDGCLGPIAAKKSMQLAIEKARNAGSGWVAVRNSNHFGMAAYYSQMAVEHDMVGITLTNAPALVAPVHSTSKMLGTNPIAVAIPANRNPTLLFDFATSALEKGKLDQMTLENKPICKGIVQDAMGNSTTDPSTLQRGGALLPLGGDLVHGGHKGFCIGALVDIFSSLFAGACFGPFVPPQVAYLPLINAPEGVGVGHFFGAIRTDAFRPTNEFKNAVDQWIETFRNAKGIEGSPGVIIPGEEERNTYMRNIKQGIVLESQVVASINQTAQQLECPELPYTPDE